MKLEKILKLTIIGVAALVISTGGILTGCTVKDTSPPQVEKPEEINEPAVLPEDSQESIMIAFEELVDNYNDIDKFVEFIDENISKVSKEKGSYMIVELENAHKAYLPKLEEKFFAEGIQAKLYEITLPDFTLPDVEEIPGGYDEIKGLLRETSDYGYKVETVEGMYFPIIKYEFYRQYRTYVQEDIADYIELMSVESNYGPAKDAGLVIGWDELLNRALGQEVIFLNKHESSVKFDEIKGLNKKYITFILYGLDNTPLFRYEDNTMTPEAKEAYLEFIERNKESELLEMIKEYVNIIERSEYKLSDEVEQFRKDVLEQ